MPSQYRLKCYVTSWSYKQYWVHALGAAMIYLLLDFYAILEVSKTGFVCND